MAKILYSKPSITELEIEYVRQAVSDGWGENCYEFVSKFESSFKNYLGVRHAVSTSSCTGALHMGMHALGIKPGDEVILADTNWVASVAPIVHLGAKPVFVDILRDSWCIDPELVESAITSRTKAILAVHMYGNLCNMNRLLDISKRYNIPLIGMLHKLLDLATFPDTLDQCHLLAFSLSMVQKPLLLVRVACLSLIMMNFMKKFLHFLIMVVQDPKPSFFGQIVSDTSIR